MNTQLRNRFVPTEATEASMGMRTRSVERSRELMAMESTCSR